MCLPFRVQNGVHTSCDLLQYIQTLGFLVVESYSKFLFICVPISFCEVDRTKIVIYLYNLLSFNFVFYFGVLKLLFLSTLKRQTKVKTQWITRIFVVLFLIQLPLKSDLFYVEVISEFTKWVILQRIFVQGRHFLMFYLFRRSTILTLFHLYLLFSLSVSEKYIFNCWFVFQYKVFLGILYSFLNLS